MDSYNRVNSTSNANVWPRMWRIYWANINAWKNVWKCDRDEKSVFDKKGLEKDIKRFILMKPHDINLPENALENLWSMLWSNSQGYK